MSNVQILLHSAPPKLGLGLVKGILGTIGGIFPKKSAGIPRNFILPQLQDPFSSTKFPTFPIWDWIQGQGIPSISASPLSLFSHLGIIKKILIIGIILLYSHGKILFFFSPREFWAPFLKKIC